MSIAAASPFPDTSATAIPSLPSPIVMKSK
jgi:hypothetical protein